MSIPLVLCPRRRRLFFLHPLFLESYREQLIRWLIPLGLCPRRRRLFILHPLFFESYRGQSIRCLFLWRCARAAGACLFCILCFLKVIAGSRLDVYSSDAVPAPQALFYILCFLKVIAGSRLDGGARLGDHGQAFVRTDHSVLNIDVLWARAGTRGRTRHTFVCLFI